MPDLNLCLFDPRRCLWDPKPRRFDSSSAAILSNFAELVVRELEMNAVMKRHLSMANMLKRAMDCYQQGYLFVDVAVPGWRIMHVNQAFSTCTGTHAAEHCRAESRHHFAHKHSEQSTCQQQACSWLHSSASCISIRFLQLYTGMLLDLLLYCTERICQGDIGLPQCRGYTCTHVNRTC